MRRWLNAKTTLAWGMAYSDNFPTRYLVNDAQRKSARPGRCCAASKGWCGFRQGDLIYWLQAEPALAKAALSDLLATLE